MVKNNGDVPVNGRESLQGSGLLQHVLSNFKNTSFGGDGTFTLLPWLGRHPNATPSARMLVK